LIGKSQAFAELKLMREELDNISEGVFSKVEAAEEVMASGGAGAGIFLALTQTVVSQHELYNALFKTIAAVERLALHLEQLWDKTS
jgi:hypothetical protein